MDTQTLQEAIDKKAIALAEKRFSEFSTSLIQAFNQAGISDYSWDQINSKKLVNLTLENIFRGGKTDSCTQAMIDKAKEEITQEIMEAIEKINEIVN